MGAVVRLDRKGSQREERWRREEGLVTSYTNTIASASST
jgi:hypothetical protein